MATESTKPTLTYFKIDTNELCEEFDLVWDEAVIQLEKELNISFEVVDLTSYTAEERMEEYPYVTVVPDVRIIQGKNSECIHPAQTVENFVSYVKTKLEKISL